MTTIIEFILTVLAIVYGPLIIGLLFFVIALISRDGHVRKR